MFLFITPGEGINNNPSIKELRLNGCKMNDKLIAILCGSVMQTSTLKILQVQRNTFGPVGAQDIANVIKSSSSIESVVLLGCNAIKQDGINILLQGLASNEGVQVLFLPDIYKHATEAEYPHLAGRLVWLPDIVHETVVDLFGMSVSIGALGKLSQYKYNVD